jgi:hypothetical protein
MSNAPAILRADWESPWRPLRDLLAVALTVVVAAAPALFWLNIFLEQASRPTVTFGKALAQNMPAIALAILWTLIILALFGPKLAEEWRAYRRSD